jgi:hypothetical protein
MTAGCRELASHLKVAAFSRPFRGQKKPGMALSPYRQSAANGSFWFGAAIAINPLSINASPPTFNMAEPFDVNELADYSDGELEQEEQETLEAGAKSDEAKT